MRGHRLYSWSCHACDPIVPKPWAGLKTAKLMAIVHVQKHTQAHCQAPSSVSTHILQFPRGATSGKTVQWFQGNDMRKAVHWSQESDIRKGGSVLSGDRHQETRFSGPRAATCGKAVQWSQGSAIWKGNSEVAGERRLKRRFIGIITCARSPFVTEPVAGLAGAVPPTGYSQATTGPVAPAAA